MSYVDVIFLGLAIYLLYIAAVILSGIIESPISQEKWWQTKLVVPMIPFFIVVFLFLLMGLAFLPDPGQQKESRVYALMKKVIPPV